MPLSRLPIAEIANYSPLVDLRKQGRIGVLRGRNFSWDIGGVKSDFSSRLVTPVDLVNGPEYVESVEIGDKHHVIVGDKVHRFDPAFEGAPTGTFVQVATLTRVQTLIDANVPESKRSFTTAFIAGKAYVCSWNYGVYRVDPVTNVYTRLNTGNTPGFPADTDPILAIIETNGRLVLLTATTVYWSGPNAPEDFVPQLGGAGAQVIGEHIGGIPTTIMQVSNGLLIWTSSGTLAGEFIAGPFVFRWFQLGSDIVPLNQTAVVKLPEGFYMALTQLGVYAIDGFGTPNRISPLFSEYLREYLKNKKIETAKLWYSYADNRVYFALRQQDSLYTETLCLDFSLDKWGIFSRPHYGLIDYASPRSPTAYVNSAGYVSYFVSAFESIKGVEDHTNPGTILGLDSFIEIGYFRVESMIIAGDTVQELTDLNVYRNPSTVGIPVADFDEGEFLVGGGDPLPPGPTLDEGILAGPPVPGDTIVDEGFLASGEINYTYHVAFVSDLLNDDPVTGINYGDREAYLAYGNRITDSWTGSVIGNYITVRISAIDPDDFYRCQTMDATLSFNGHITGG